MILLVYHVYEREYHILESIKKAFLEINQNFEIEIVSTPEYIKKAFQLKPFIIIRPPFFSKKTSNHLHLIKHLFKTKIFTYSTEGVVNLKSKEQLEWLSGFEDHDVNLCDGMFFWGEKTCQLLGNLAVKKNKLSSKDRALQVGYVDYEKYFFGNQGEHLSELQDYEKENRVLLATGFHFASYTEEMIINAGDLIDTTNNFFKEIDKALNARNNLRIYRQMWIDNIIKCAKEYPHILFVLKTHPIENTLKERLKSSQFYGTNGIDVYNQFKPYQNILVIENIPISELQKEVSLFFHYGSTTLAEAYLNKIPSVFVTSHKLYNGGKDYSHSTYIASDLGWESNFRIDINNLDTIIKIHSKNPLTFELNEKMLETLNDFFSIKKSHINGDTSYYPSKKIAELSLETEIQLIKNRKFIEKDLDISEKFLVELNVDKKSIIKEIQSY